MTRTPVIKEKVTPADKNRPVLYVNKGYKQFGILSHVDHLGIHIQFAMNIDLLIANTGELYFVALD